MGEQRFTGRDDRFHFAELGAVTDAWVKDMVLIPPSRPTARRLAVHHGAAEHRHGRGRRLGVG